MNGCFHIPPCSTASVHHARRGSEGRVLREAAAVSVPAEPSWTPARSNRPAENRRIPECKASPQTLRAAVGRKPWELNAEEFDAVCEPWFEPDPREPRNQRMFGLSVSQMRFGLRLRLVMLGAPEGGFVADVDKSDEASLDDPRRAFVADALAHGERVPAHVLADYPDLLPQP